MTTGSTRDRLLEQQLRRALRSGADAPATEACLDAERLAVWVEGGLEAREAEATEHHVSSCARCQALVGVMARIEPVWPALAPRWRRLWPAWVVPLTAGAAAAVLWMVAPTERPTAPAEKVAASAESAQARVETPQAPLPPATPSAPVRSEAFRRPPAGREATVRAPNPMAGAERAAKSAPVEPRSEAAANEVRLPDRRVDVDASVADRAAAGAASRQAPAGAAPQAQAFGRLVAAEPPAIEIPSPDAAVRWRLTGGAGVERTTDGGASWEALPTGASAPLIAGSAPSPEVCWLVGRNGTVLLTTDGRTWRRVAFPEPVDLVGVQSTGARSAAVTAADGRVFRTNDAGATWTPR